MRREPRAFLWDAREGVLAIMEFVADRRYQDYLHDRMLRSAVERQFEIIGEALGQLSKLHPEVAGRIRDARPAVAFRNLLIHGYAAIDHDVVWRAVCEDLPRLREDRDTLLEELGGTP